MCYVSRQWEVIKALSRETWGLVCILVKMWPGEGPGGPLSWRQQPAGRDETRALVEEAPSQRAGSEKLDGNQGRHTLAASLGIPKFMERGSNYSWRQVTSTQAPLASPACSGLWSWASHLTCSHLSFLIRDEMQSSCEDLMQSLAWAWHSWHSFDIAAIFRVPIYKTGILFPVLVDGEAAGLPELLYLGAQLGT